MEQGVLNCYGEFDISSFNYAKINYYGNFINPLNIFS